MPMNEFALIKRYFERSDDDKSDHGGAVVQAPAQGVVQGIGDDCAVLSTDPDYETVISTDTLISGVHFPENSDSRLIAQRALRVNLSDIAAMGGQPSAFLLALTLPELNETWLEGFSRGLREVSDTYSCPLVGGDTTRGPLSITISILGTVPRGRALFRSGAQVGDTIYVTGYLGDGAAGLGLLDVPIQGDGSEARSVDYLQKRYWQPDPRVSEGLILRDYASAAIDISDGLLADLGHILRASCVGAELTMASIPLSAPLIDTGTKKEAITLALTGGDDYELCFTVPIDKVAMLELKVREGLLSAFRIGEISAKEGLICRDGSGTVVDFSDAGYQHF
ncbi:MAG: thiamine-phosphate kinase [Porticoccaceae bacterium]|nr:thiamine-phosphate kinase [Porticoccaceae bacterium]